jgi:malonate-semialdehyde dehydrogenase (acetylating)/methylmalonate-semialdehyde dehydrogenase
LPDADKETALNAVVGSAFGAAGQRCMANSVGIFVGKAREWLPELAERAASLKVTEGHQKEAHLGPLITSAAKERAISITENSVKQGAKMLLDGTKLKVPGYEKGNFLGPTLLGDVTRDMQCYKQEIFAPVFSTMCADTLEDAIEIVNSNEYGNGTSIVTSSGAAARKYQSEVECGQVGVNVPIPVGLYFFGFTGWKKSFVGSHHFYGQDGINFFTDTKTVITSWKYSGSQEMQVTFPVNK